MDEILNLLVSRDQEFEKNVMWKSSVACSRSILENETQIAELHSTIETFQSTMDKIHEERVANSEQGRLLHDIENVENQIKELQIHLEKVTERKKLLTADVAALETEASPMLTRAADDNKRKKELSQAIAVLTDELKKKTDIHEEFQMDYSEKNAEFARLRQEEIVTQDKLLKLRTREAEMRNDVEFTKSSAPAIDVSAFKVAIPMIKGEKDDDENVDTSTIDFDVLKGTQSLSAQKFHSQPVSCLAFANTKSFLASGGEDCLCNIVRTDTYKRVACLSDAKRTIMSVAFAPTDQLLLTASYDSSIRFYRLPTFQLVQTCADNRDCVNDAAFISDEHFVSCCRDQTIKLFDINRGTPQSVFTSTSTPYSLYASSGESLVVTAHHDGKIRAWDFRTQGVPIEIKTHKKNVIRVLGMPRSSLIISLSADNTIAVSDLRMKAIQGRVNIQQAGMPSDHMQIAMVETRAISGGTSGNLFSWDLSSFRAMSSMKAHDVPVFCVAVKPTSGLMASGDKSGVIKFWNR